MKKLIYEYDPFKGMFDSEIPCYRIYSGDEFVASTNEELPDEVQENIAQLLTKADDLLLSLGNAVAALKTGPNFQTDLGISSHVLAANLEKTLFEING